MSIPDSYASIAEFYDAVPFYAERQDVAFYVQSAIASGGPVLELGCGTGRVLIPTARTGVTVTGIDRSRSMLRTCKARLQIESEFVRSRTELLVADMRHFHVRRRFALAMIPFRSFQHLLTVEDQLACSTTIRDLLRVDGQLVFDVFNPSRDMLVSSNIGHESEKEPAFAMRDGRTVFRRHRIVSHDPLTQITHREFIYYVTHADGRRERLVHSCRLRNTYKCEAEHLLVRAGFRVDGLYADLSEVAHGPKYRGELICVARRS